MNGPPEKVAEWFDAPRLIPDNGGVQLNALLRALFVVSSLLAPSCSPAAARQSALDQETQTSQTPNSQGDEQDAAKEIAKSARDGGAAPATGQAPTEHQRRLKVTFFDVGQGDGALVQTPGGKVVLIDGGPPEAGPSLVRRLKTLGISAIDLIIASHPHADHIGGLLDVVREFPVRAFLDSGVPHTTPMLRDYLVEVERQKEKNGAKLWIARKGRTITLDDGTVVLEVLAPEEPLLSGTRSDVNSNSIVVRLSYGSFAILFTGDAEAGTEERLVKQADRVRASILKVAHHGSRHSTTPAFLRAVSPTTAVISCGRGNSYGHPKAKTLKALEAIAKVFRTDRDGTITVTSDGKTSEIDKLGVDEATKVGTAKVGTEEPGKSAPSAAYVASRRAKTFHRSDCPSVAKIRARNRVKFGTWGEAAASRRKPHRGCMP